MFKLPSNFQVGQTNRDADCFFDSVAQGLKQLKPELNINVKSLRLICKSFAQSQLENDNSWLKKALKREDKQINEYIQSVEFTANDIDQKSEAAKVLGLTSPIWGRSKIEGRIICAEYNVQLHVAEKHFVEGEEVWTYQIVDSAACRSVRTLDYHNQENTLQIINRTDLIFEPILRIDEFQFNEEASDDDEEDDISAEEELFHIVRSKKSEVVKLTKVRKHLRRSPKLDINFQGKNNDTCLHIAVRKKELHLIKLLVKKGARTDIKNDKDRSPIDVARRLKREDIVKILKLDIPKILIEEPVETNQENSDGKNKEFDQEESTLCSTNGELPPEKLLKDDQITKGENSKIAYEKRPGTAGMHGQLYEIELLMLILLQAEAEERVKKIISFHLATNMQEAGDFDDIVFKYKHFENEVEKAKIIFLQAKHKEAEKERRITIDTLLSQSEKGDFLLRKYLSSYRKIEELKTKKDHPLFQDKLDSTDFIIFTNAALKLDNSDNLIENYLGPQDMLYFNEKPEKIYYTLTANEKVKNALKLSLDYSILVRELAQSVYSGNVDSSKLIFKDYQNSLVEEVFEISETNKKEGQFKEDFLDGAQDKEFTLAFLEEIKKNQNFSKTFSAKSDDELKEELRDRIIKLPENFGRAHDNDFKLSLPSKTIPDETIEAFLSDLKLFFNQPNVNQLEDTIKKAIINVFDIEQEDDANLIYSNVHNTVTKWWREQKQLKYLTERDKLFNNAKENLSNMNLVGLAILQAERIKSLGFNFKRDQIERLSKLISQKRVLNIITHEDGVLLSTVKVYQALEGMNEYKSKDYSCKYIFLSLTSVLRLQNLVINAFKSEKRDLLVIECEETETSFAKFYKQLVDTVKLNSRKKIVLITRGRGRLAEQFKNDFSKDNQYEEEVDRNNNLADLEIESQILIEEKQVNFQGIEMELGTLVDETSKHLVGADVLSKLINSEEIEVDKTPSDLGEIKYYYINRIFHRRINIKKEFFKEKNFKDITVVSNLTKKQLSLLADGEKARKFTDTDPDKQNPVRFIVINDDLYVQENLKQLHNQYHGKYNVHWLKKEDDTFIWQKTHGSISQLLEFVDTENINEYPADKITNIADRVVVVSAEPGMGKSVLLTQLTAKEKKADPPMWVVRLNLNDYTKQLNEIKFDKNNLNGTINFLCEIIDLTSPLEKGLFKYRVEHYGRIAILFDGFDEVSPYYKEKVITLVKILRETKIDKLWITTRPHMRDELEHKLNVFSYTLKPISAEEQENFLKRYWSKKLDFNVRTDDNRLNSYIDELLKVLSRSIADKERDFTGIPLQTRMLAEVYQDQFQKFYNSDESMPIFPSKLDLLDLYLSFIDKKYDIYWLEKNKADLTLTGVSEVYEKYHSEFILQHQLLALQMLFSEQELHSLLSMREKQNIVDFKQDVIHGHERTGIINRIFNGTIHFIHRTFAEYFTALWLADNRDRREVKSLLQNKLFETENRVLRNFFDRILAGPNSYGDNYEMHTAILNNDIKTIEGIHLASSGRKVDKGGRTALHLAAAYGFSNIVEILLHYYPKGIRIEDKIFGWRPLSYADKGGHWQVVELLLQRGAVRSDMFSAISKINFLNRQGETLLHEAAKRDFIKFAEFLIQRGANIHARTHNYMTPLHCAAKSGSYDVVRLLIEQGADLNCQNKDGKTVLDDAARKGHWDVVMLLIYTGANFNCQTTFGDIVLQDAARTGNWGVVKLLIAKGADFNYQTTYSDTVLHDVASRGLWDIVKILIKTGAYLNGQNRDGKTVLYLASKKGHWDVVKLLIEKGADFSYPSYSGNTVLHDAARTGNLDIVKLLIRKGADFNCKTKFGDTVLHSAAEGGNTGIVKLLIEKGVDLDCQNNSGNTALHYAADNEHWEIVKLLIDSGADFDCQNDDGSTVLHSATIESKLEIVKLLIDNGVDFNCRNNRGSTALHFAANNDHFDLVKLLINEGADLNCQNNFGNTVLHYAAYNKNWDLVKLLIEKGADFSLQNENGKTCLYYAERNGNNEIVNLLKSKGANFESSINNGDNLLDGKRKKSNKVLECSLIHIIRKLIHN